MKSPQLLRGVRLRVALIAVVVVGVSAWLWFSGGGKEVSAEYGTAMGTQWSLVLTSSVGQAERAQARKLVDQALEEVEQESSHWRENSEISRVNNMPVAEPVALSAGLFEVLLQAQRAWQDTDGAFDPTLGEVHALWGFGPSRSDAWTAPQDAALTLASERMGMHYIQLDVETRTLTKLAPVSIDLSAIAKGQGIDRAAHALVAAGWHNFLLEVGGEVATRGAKENEKPWIVGIQTPGTEHGDNQITTLLQAPPSYLNVATSGDYRNFREQDGQRLTHIMDPATGQPVFNDIASASVANAGSVMAADAFATAMMVLGVEKAMELAQDKRLAVQLLVRDPTARDQLRIHSNQAWDALVLANLVGEN